MPPVMNISFRSTVKDRYCFRLTWIASTVACLSSAAFQVALPNAEAAYVLNTVVVGSNVENQFLSDGFHFATLISDPQGRLIFRPHPDRYDVNGWGVSYVLNPFLSGGEPGQGVANGITTSAGGFAISTTGVVRRTGGSSYGNWDWQVALSYDSSAQRVVGSGTLDVSLNGTLSAAAADLNLSRIADNFLHNVPLQGGGNGDTGDMQRADIAYSSTGDPRDFSWYPPDLPAHFPFDFSQYLKISAIGDINSVDTLALGASFQIEVARKPTFALALASASPQDQMIAGLMWDESEATNFAADNIGMNHLVIQGTTTHTEMSFDLQFESVPPDYLPGDANFDGVVD